MRGKIYRVSLWFRQARKLPLTACGRMAKSVNRGLHVVLSSVRWNNVRKTPETPLPFASALCGRLYCFFTLVSVFAFAVVFSMFPSSWPDTAPFRSCLSLPLGFLDTLEAGICEGSRACCFFFVSPFVLLNSDVPCES